ncbi:MAG TPA: hypothetical protein P5032_17885 [Candidatus Competibacter sp.]|nr:hypothetical protein [Candidatus Competibacteraceae bacterium]HRW67572.1 hypothetical protein [Candidatus Competibacter sp.]
MSEAWPPPAVATGLTVEQLVFPDGEGVLYRQAFAPAESACLLAALHRETAWQQQVIVLYGRSIASPWMSAYCSRVFD